MKILLHSNAPWIPSGYGQQTALFAPRIASLGHDVEISAFSGLAGHAMTWNGFTVHPAGEQQFGNDVLPLRSQHFFGDDLGIVITLCDVWVLDPDIAKDISMASWFPVDCAPLSRVDRDWFERSTSVPITMSRHGEKMALEAGLAPLYVPHGIDTNVFAPVDDRSVLREALGIPTDAFVIGMNAANKSMEPSRKAFCQQFEAFARLRRKHSDALMFCHTRVESQYGVSLDPLLRDLGIADAVLFTDQYAYTHGLTKPEYLAAMYGACDLVTNASYGEGFGLAIIEAQACGTPVVVTDASAMPELVGAGWTVRGDRYWNPVHEAWWKAPSVDDLARVYRKAYDGQAAKRREQAREFALTYDADRVLVDHWKPALELLEQAVEAKAA